MWPLPARVSATRGCAACMILLESGRGGQGGLIRRIICVAVMGLFGLCGQSAAQVDHCSDTLHPLLAQLSTWVYSSDSALSYRYCVFVSGASLALAYTEADGFTVPLRQAALWPGYVFETLDSLYQPVRAFSWSEAESLLVADAARRGVLLLTEQPVVVTGIDTSLGAPWFFVSMCDSSEWVSAIWDRADFKQTWWQKMESPGARVLWPVPDSSSIKIGRQVVKTGMRNAVLTARPDSSSGLYFGLAASIAAAQTPGAMPGAAGELRLITQLRQMGSEFLAAHAELWPPDRREPIQLAAYYFQKSAEAWRTVSVVVDTWLDYDAGQRRDWLAAIRDWDTKAAVALDEIVSASR